MSRVIKTALVLLCCTSGRAGTSGLDAVQDGELLWDNGEWDKAGALSSERNTLITESWSVDDVVFGRPVRIKELHWVAMMYTLPAAADLILLDAALETLGELSDLAYFRQHAGSIFGTPYYNVRVVGLNVTLPAGHYYIGGRLVGQGVGRAFTANQRTMYGLTQGYFRSEYFGYPDWVPISTVDFAYDLNFRVYGAFGRYGDLNCDGVIDFGDVNPFVMALSDPDEYDRQHPDCNLYNGDCNADQKVDFGDINAFVELLAGR